jgi:hypothetical protein
MMDSRRPTGVPPFILHPHRYGCPFASPARWSRVMLVSATTARNDRALTRQLPMGGSDSASNVDRLAALPATPDPRLVA